MVKHGVKAAWTLRFPFLLFIHKPGMVRSSGSCCNPLGLWVPSLQRGETQDRKTQHQPPASLRRDAMAMAAAPYLHPRLTAIDAKMSPAAAHPSPQKLLLEFVLPTRDHAREDQE
jgi:hypothetical protein